MEEMPCKIVSAFMREFKQHFNNFKNELNKNPGKDEIGEVATMGKLLEMVYSTFVEQNMTVDSMIRRIDTIENWQVLFAELANDEVKKSIKKSHQTFYFLIKFLFGRFPIMDSSQEEIDKFYKSLENPELLGALSDIEKLLKEEVGVEDITKEILIDAFQSAFVNSLAAKDGEIVKVKHNVASDYIGFRHQKGELHIQNAGHHLCEHMIGGIVVANRTNGFAGMQMSGGELYLKSGSGGAGMLMNGGKLFIGSYCEKAGYCAVGGTIFANNIDIGGTSSGIQNVCVLGHFGGLNLMKGHGCVITKSYNHGYDHEIAFTLLADQVENYKDQPMRGSIYIYDQVEKKYTAPDTTVTIPTIVDTRELAEWKEKKNGLCILDVGTKLDNVTEGMEDGIMVIRNDEIVNIGKGMQGGAVIIETTQPIETVRQRLSKEDRVDGTILMRIPDKKKEGQTKLIDLEVKYPEFLDEEEIDL